MTSQSYILIFIIILVIILEPIIISKLKDKNHKKCTKFPYKKKMLLTKTEYSFYHVLKKECDQRNLLICPKVRMEDFLEVTDKENLMKYRGYIKSRHIDFIICDTKLHMLAGVELDDKSHNSKRARESDDLKNNIFQTIKTPLYRIPVNQKKYESSIQNALNELLQHNQ